MTEEILSRHKLAFYEDNITYPRIINPEGLTIGAIGAVVAAITTGGDPIAVLKGFGGGTLAQILARTGFSYAKQQIARLSDPFYHYLGFNPKGFVLLTGFKKSSGRELVTMDFQPTRLPVDEANDKESAEILARAISGAQQQLPPFSRDELTLKGEEFLNKLLTKDVLAVGGPINIDPLYEPMRSKTLPCSHELENPATFPLHETGGVAFYRYEIVRKGRQEPLIPEWNRLNWGMITCVEKSVILPNEGKGGLFLSISGCNWLGVRGAAVFLYNKENMRRLKDAVKNKLGKVKNFQAIIKVPLSASPDLRIDHNRIQLMEDEIYGVH